MTLRRITPLTLITFLVAIVFSLDAAPKGKRKPKKKKAAPIINQDAKGVAKAIPKFNASATKKVAVDQMTHLIHLLAKINRGSLSSNAALVRTAMDMRDDIGDHQKTISMGAIMKAWDAADSYGAISGDHFYGQATEGRYAEDDLMFENIVPAEELPACKGYIGNLRLVPASMARKSGEPLDHRDEAYAIGLKQVMYESKSRAAMLEIERSKVGHLALSPAQHEERWRAAVAATGDDYKRQPNLQLHAQKMGSPSKLNGQRYKLRVEVTNMSRHPTEVVVESTMVGYSDNGNELYEMRRDTRTLKLRRSQVEAYHLQTPPITVFKQPLKKFDSEKSDRVMYRGFTLVVKFNGKVIQSTGSDARLMRVASGEYAAPQMITKASRTAPAPATPSQGGSSYDLMRFKSPMDLASGKDGENIGYAPSETLAIMADVERMYRLDSDGGLWIYESPSFGAASKSLGGIFAGSSVLSMFSDGFRYYLHLSEAAGDYAGNDVVMFPSLEDMISGYNGSVVGQAAPGSTSFLSDGKSFFKLHHGEIKQSLLSCESLEYLTANTKPHYQSEGELFTGRKKAIAFSDGVHYFLMAPSAAKQ